MSKGGCVSRFFISQVCILVFQVFFIWRIRKYFLAFAFKKLLFESITLLFYNTLVSLGDYANDESKVYEKNDCLIVRLRLIAEENVSKIVKYC